MMLLTGEARQPGREHILSVVLSPRPTSVRLAEVVATLSLAIDMGMGLPSDYGLRSCVVAVRLGEAAGLSEPELADVYYLALLRHAGCTADAPLAAEAFGDEIAASSWLHAVDYGSPAEMLGTIARRVGEDQPLWDRARLLFAALTGMPRLLGSARAHCEVAQRLAERLGLGARLDTALLQASERWNGRGLPSGIKGEAILLPARVVLLAHEAETFYQLGGVEAAVAVVRQRSGAAYDPRLAEVFCRQAPGILARSETESAWGVALAAEPGPRPRLAGSRLDDAVRAVADFTDLKSPYTGGHSSGVAELAAGAAQACRLPEAEVHALRWAGHLHDLGRVGVSSSVWEKRTRLADEEWERARLHPYYTERVLRRSDAFAPLGTLAGLHHERLDGSGYHRGSAAAQLSPAARILAAADVYHALREPRPHRPAFSSDAAAQEMQREVRGGRLDGDAANAVLAAAGHRVRAARRERPGGLSEREVEVLRLLARGLSNREMARRLVISPGTVHQHVQHIYNKLGVSTRPAATLFALQHDLLNEGLQID
jgi:HD-GYP domain-containing protein (c-di-GMP phosphodiesterase class II)